MSASWTRSYTDTPYLCRRCQARTIFSAADKTFLAHWLQTIELRERYGFHRHDVARKNMLRHLLDQP